MDIWYFSRSGLAGQYLKIFDAGITSNLAIIAPRRKGKTLFVLNDVARLARRKSYIPVYASLWQNINSPQDALIAALREAIGAIDKKTPFSRLLSAKIKKAALSNDLIGKVELEFADHPQKASGKDLMLLDELLSILQKKAKNKTVLLLVDEVQHLATSDKFAALTHALRTLLDKRLGKVKAIFTGSSRHYMNLLFNESQSPFYNFVEIAPFSDLGEEFIGFISESLKKRHHLTVDNNALIAAFNAVDQSPYWMMKVIAHMITFHKSINDALSYVSQLIEAAEGLDVVAKKLKPIDRFVFLTLAAGESPFSKVALSKIDKETSVRGIPSNVQRSLQRLIELNLVSQLAKGEYKIEKPGLKRYLTDSPSRD